MSIAVRFFVLPVFGLVLLSGCGSDSDGGAPAADSPSTPAATSPAAPESTSSSETPGEDPISITLYDADFTVDASGDLAVVETLTLDVTVDDRRGIFRTFAGDVQVEGFTATLDGGPTPIGDDVENGQRTFQIGDPDRTLDIGEHSVRMEYSVADVLTSDGAGARLFDWVLVPDGWTMDILASELSVNLPVDATTATCAIGDEQPCDVSGVGTKTLVVETGELVAGTAVLALAQLSNR